MNPNSNVCFKKLSLNDNHYDYVVSIVRKQWNLKTSAAKKIIDDIINTHTDSAIWCAFIEKQLIGFGVFDYYNAGIIDAPKSNKYPWLFLLWILPNYRGRDLGNVITDKLLTYCKSLGHNKVYIDCTDDVLKYHLNNKWIFLNTSPFKNTTVNILFKSL